jgi:hypothetical protein
LGWKRGTGVYRGNNRVGRKAKVYIEEGTKLIGRKVQVYAEELSGFFAHVYAEGKKRF